MVTTTDMLNRTSAIDYIVQRARSFNLDPAAVLSIVSVEGLNAAPGSIWNDPPGVAFGPFSWNTAGAGGTLLSKNNLTLTQGANWSWTPAGIDYGLQQLANAGAAGKSGIASITAIATNFERPADIPGEIRDALGRYSKWQQVVTGAPASTTQLPTPANPTQPGSGQGSAPDAPSLQNPAITASSAGASVIQAIAVGLLGPALKRAQLSGINVDLSGIILFLIALALIFLGAILWQKDNIVTVVKDSALAAV